MTNTTANTELTVAAIVEERQRYESWLTALEAKRGVTPTHVYERVHADYTARLQRASEQLMAHRSSVHTLANQIADRIAYLDIDDVKHRDELAEAQLRAAVGELSAEVCGDQIRKAEAALASLQQERSSLDSQLQRFRAILEMTSGPTAPPHEARAGPTVPPAAASQAPRREAEHSKNDFDDLAFLKSVVVPRPTDAVPREAARAVPAHPRADTENHFADLQSSFPAMQSAPGAQTPPQSVTDSGRREPDTGPGVDTRRSSAKEMSDTVPSFLKDVPVEQVKTLKCQECATLNYPTEWYCERCGAELAAL